LYPFILAIGLAVLAAQNHVLEKRVEEQSRYIVDGAIQFPALEKRVEEQSKCNAELNNIILPKREAVGFGAVQEKRVEEAQSKYEDLGFGAVQFHALEKRVEEQSKYIAERNSMRISNHPDLVKTLPTRVNGMRQLKGKPRSKNDRSNGPSAGPRGLQGSFPTP
jgi:hypothetical protein